MRRSIAAGTVMLLATSAGAQDAKPTSGAPPLMQRWTPALAGYTDQVLFGDVWLRSELSSRDRSLVTVAALIATGKTAQLKGHLGRALDNGVRPSEIAGLVTHLAFYSGWPSAVSALEVVDQVFRARGVDPDSVRTSTALLPVPTSEAGA
ncbi:carboxymuconolactone decarboxylase family protein [Sphingomonas sp. LB2R24]|uniref:carboxymuconolactone decarboxylase family protein n=1 Tax=Sphingomonas sorbitolis TaxID=3096165 RepID=UPI002FCB03C9